MDASISTRRWLRKQKVAQRYGWETARSVERAVKAGRLPLPKFPLGNAIPFWDELELEQHERHLTALAATTRQTRGPIPNSRKQKAQSHEQTTTDASTGSSAAEGGRREGLAEKARCSGDEDLF
jgi:hypothetical protein